MPDTKHEVTVKAQAAFIPDQSNPDQQRYVFAYRMTITNVGNVACQLISRHWIITDANGKVEEVKGDGVVGEQPLLHPKQSFEYTSGAALATPVGTMRGSYHMLGDDGVKFEATIPEFTLAMPRMLH
jgi:ApaG protein